jgi:hypothetical protein
MDKLFSILIAITFMNTSNDNIIFDFNKDANISNFRVVDDGVMGGLSQGNFKINEKGNGVYSGIVSLENNGGFSSLRYRFLKKDVSKFSKICIRLKGDMKSYQFRVKDDINNYYSHVKSFPTSGKWENVEIDLVEMHPQFRGRKLDMSNFSSNEIEEIAILIGNKKNENFCLEIDNIILK